MESSYLFLGNVTVNVEPSPSLLLIEISPPSMPASRRLIALVPDRFLRRI
ncbi:MAG: hypothetical protein R3C56_21070 [Pirellulaceae bacterium]